MASRSARRNADVLYEVISTVASTLELDEVLRAVVRLLSEASAVHACFVYLLDDIGDRLVLAAASEPYGHLVGQVTLDRGEGLAWWVIERDEPAFIRDGLLDDPRVKYVPELEEERFQSLVSVPIHGRSGLTIGVVSAHTEAPREFTQDEVDFLLSSATLVAGAIENARLYEEMRTRVRELEGLTALAETVAQAETLDELLNEVAACARGLLRASSASVYLLEPGSEELERRATEPTGAEARDRIGLAELGPELSRGGRASRIAVPLVASEELLGLLVARSSTEVDLARAVASQTAVGIKKIQLIERLTEKNLIKDFFEDLAAGRVTVDLEGRAARLGCDLEVPYLVLAAEPAGDALERGLAAALPRSVFDRRGDALRALLRVPLGGAERVVESVRRVHAQVAPGVVIGLSSVCSGAASFGDGFEEARQAVLGTAVLKREPAVTVFDELGAYKYLLRIALEGGVRDATVEAVARIAEYDTQRGTSLLVTLEEFLRRRGNISATSEALYVHQNTLRQRLRRIGELSGLDLRRDDWLVVEIAVKMVQLRSALRDRASRHFRPVEGGDSLPRAAGAKGGRNRREPTEEERMGAADARLEQIRKVVGKRGIEFFFAQFVDLYGRPSAKLVPAAYLDSLVEEGAGFAGFAAGELGQVPADPDIAAVPDLDSFTPVPWQPNLARFACDVTVEGEPWPYCPRTILRRVLAEARDRGYELKLGLELEYFLVNLEEDGSIQIADKYDTLEKPCYDMAGLTRRYDFLTTVSKYCNELGWGNYANDHEDANGQFEQNFTYDDALVSCDRAIFFRYMVHTLAEQHGMIATFMPKPFTHLTGNGCHFHLSLWDGERNLFLDEADPRGLGLSELGYNFVGGLKTHARASSALTAPTVNSYKRLKVGTTASGATWSPVWISYGYNNRTQMLRIPGPGRIEDRTIDGSCNPYLAAATVLAAGLDGIERGLDAGEPNGENLYAIPYAELRARGLETLPTNLLNAVDELEADDVLRQALGRGRDEDYVDYYIRVKRDEWNAFHEQVTPWELREYLTRF